MTQTIEERYWAKVDTSGGPDACWPWLGALTDTGYGQFWDGTRVVRAHRFAIGDTTSTLDGDHLCHNGSGCAGGPTCLHRRCCNPAHIELVPRQVNAARGQTGRQSTGWKSECIHGHAYDDRNTYLDRNGHQRCRECARTYQRNRRTKEAA